MIVRFHEFLLNADTRQVIAPEGDVHLSPKAFELLLILVENRTRALTKAELQQRLWPATFVEETNLATLVAEIRRALRDSAQDPRVVRTVHRFGYRFVAQVDDQDKSPAGLQTTRRLFVSHGSRRFALLEGTSILGRGTDATIRLDSAGVSRHHARIAVAGDLAHLEDLGSKNGTFLQGRRVADSTPLEDGDEIRLGPVALTFHTVPLSAPTETVA